MWETQEASFEAVPGVRVNTIDAYPKDNGFLPCARQADPKGGAHRSTAEAAATLGRMLGGARGVCQITGHGADGLLVTGTGQTADDPDKLIAAWNAGNWEPHLRGLRGRVAHLQLWGCHPGTGEEGADLLYALAQLIDAPASGPTGFLNCNGGRMTLEAGSTWQTATPTQRPRPIPAPSSHLRFKSMQIRLRQAGRETVVDLDAVREVSLAAPGDARESLASLSGEEARNLSATILWDEPFAVTGKPAAVETGVLRIVFQAPGGPVEKRFRLFNDRLIEDLDEPDVFYRASEALRPLLNGLR